MFASARKRKEKREGGEEKGEGSNSSSGPVLINWVVNAPTQHVALLSYLQNIVEFA